MALPKIGSVYFEDMNFVQGFERPGCWSVVEDVHPYLACGDRICNIFWKLFVWQTLLLYPFGL